MLPISCTPRSIRKRGEPGPGDLRVVLLGIRTDADCPDHFTIHDDRQRTLHFDEATRGGGSEATTVDRILEGLAWLLEQGRRPCLTRRKFDAARRAA